MKLKIFRILVLLAVSNALAGSALAERFSKLVVFSGSLTDTGNYAALNGDLPPPFYMNRSTNGPSSIDIFGEQLGLSTDASRFLVGEDAGTNYAVLGALAGGDRDIDLAAQVDAYLIPRGEVADPDALYFIFVGVNDVVEASFQPNDEAANEVLNAGVRQIKETIKRLRRAGARTFQVGNAMDLSFAPFAQWTGVGPRITQLTPVFNRRMKKKLDRLEERYSDIKLIRFDFFSFMEDVVANVDHLQFYNITDPCIYLIPSGQCDLDTFGFLTEVYPTARVHLLLGHAFISSLLEGLNEADDDDSSDDDN